MRGVPGLFLTRGRNDRMPPHIGGEFAARRFLFGHQTGCHVGFAVYRIRIEVVFLRVLDIHQDIVVLSGPALCRFCAVVVGPNDLVDKTIAPKNHVAHDLGVVNFTPIEVQVEGAILCEQTVSLPNTRL